MTLTIRPIKLDPRQRAMCEQRVTFTGDCGAKSNYLVQFKKSQHETVDLALCNEHARKAIDGMMVYMAQSYGEIES